MFYATYDLFKSFRHLTETSEQQIELRKAAREYYAMRLVIEARGIKDYPEALQTVELSAEDGALDAEGKMRLATEMVLDDGYYAQKDVIRENMRASLDELERMAYDTDASALRALREELNVVRAVIVLQTVGIFFVVWLTSRLGIHPVLNAVERIKNDSPIPEVGANEFSIWRTPTRFIPKRRTQSRRERSERGYSHVHLPRGFEKSI